MSEAYHQFLLSIQFGAIGDGSTEPPQPFIRTVASVLEGVKLLVMLPMDQFHPVAAKLSHLDYYIDRMELTDLTNGKPVLTIDRPVDLLNRNDTISIVVSDGYSLGTVAAELVGKKHSQANQTTHFPWLKYFPLYECLGPSTNYHKIYQAVINDTVTDELSMAYSNYVVAINGTQMVNGAIVNGKLQFPFTFQYHFFDRKDDAMAYLLRCPASHFHQSTALENNLTYFVNEAQLQTTQDPVAVVALISMIAPKRKNGAVEEFGRYLALFDAAKPLLAPLDISPIPSIQNGNVIIMQLDRWSQKEAYSLESTGAASHLITQLEQVRQQPIEDLSFVTHKERVMALTGAHAERHGESAELHLHVHTQSLSLALNELNNHSIYDHDPLSVEQDDGRMLTLRAKICDKVGTELFVICSSKEINFKSEGIYLGVHKDWQSHPDFLRLFPQQLLQGDMFAWLPHGDLHYIKIGIKVKGKLYPTIAYQKFQLLQRAMAVDAYTRQQRNLVNAGIVPHKGHGVALEFLWQMAPPGARPFNIEVRKSFPNAASARDWMMKVENPGLFSGDAFKESGPPMRLIWILQLEGDRHQKLVDARFDMMNPAVVQFAEEKKAWFPHMATVLDHVIDVIQAVQHMKRQGPPQPFRVRPPVEEKPTRKPKL